MVNDLPQFLEDRLRRPLPGRAAHRPFEPELSYGRHQGPPRFDARPAAVAVLFYRSHSQWKIPLTVRAHHLSHHAGQVSLPGGAIEPGESFHQAALRELAEELGVPSDHCQVLGCATPVYVFATNFHVVPCLAVARTPIQLCPNSEEVEEVIEVPLAALSDNSLAGGHCVRRNAMEFFAPHLDWNGRFIWGATYLILAEVAMLLKDFQTDLPM